MNFAKTAFLILFLTLPAWSEVPFSVSTTPSADPTKADEETGNSTIARLKTQAVAQWLQGYLGSRYPQFERSITPSFAEKYILTYKLGRTGANKELIELSGQLDSESLKSWVRLLETKGKSGGSLKPLFLVSSSMPGLTLKAEETSSNQGQSVFVQAASQLLTAELQKLNTRPYLASGSLSSSEPPATERGISQLRDSLARDGNSVAIWVDLNQCRGCETPRVDIYLYSFINPRLISVLSEEFPLSSREYGNADRWRATLAPIFQTFQKSLEAAVGQGRLYAVPLSITVENVDSYRAYRQIEIGLAKQDLLIDLTPKILANRSAEFGALTNGSLEDLAHRIQQTDFPGFSLKPVRIDSRTLVVRYLGQSS